MSRPLLLQSRPQSARAAASRRDPQQADNRKALQRTKMRRCRGRPTTGGRDGGSGRMAPRGPATGSRRGLLLRRAAAPPPATAAGRAETMRRRRRPSGDGTTVGRPDPRPADPARTEASCDGDESRRGGGGGARTGARTVRRRRAGGRGRRRTATGWTGAPEGGKKIGTAALLLLRLDLRVWGYWRSRPREGRSILPGTVQRR